MEEEAEGQIAVEERERGRDALGVIEEREGKEVRVNFPVAMSGGVANDWKAGVDDDEDDSVEEDNMDIAAGQPEDGTRRAQKTHRRQRSNQTKSKMSTSTDGVGSLDVGGAAATTTGVNPHIGFASNAIPTTAAQRSGATPGTAERAGFGFGQRMKNPNAQPYYAYAAMANSYGYGTSSGGRGVYRFYINLKSYSRLCTNPKRFLCRHFPLGNSPHACDLTHTRDWNYRYCSAPWHIQRPFALAIAVEV
jgi:hypothetical protein